MEEIESICLRQADTGRVYLRNAVVLACFVERTASEITDSVAAMLDEYLSGIPPDVLKWVVPTSSSEQWERFDSKTLPGIKRMIAPKAAKARDLTSFRLSDSPGEAPEFEFQFVSRPKSYESPPACSLVQMVFPIEMVRPEHVENLVERVRTLSKLINLSYGYCSPALLYSEAGLLDAYTAIRGIALRHPGYDVQNNTLAAWVQGPVVRGARWITLLGAPLLAEAGGIESLRQALPEAVSIEMIVSFALIRAGRQPEIGDSNRQKDTPLLRQLARVLEPLTRFGEEDLIFTRLDDDSVFLDRWEHRFLDRSMGNG